MIIVFNWKDKTVPNYQNVFFYYQELARKVLLIVCPHKTFFKKQFYKYSSLNIKYCTQKPELKLLQSIDEHKFDYVMLNHQRFKQFLDPNAVKSIVNFNKIPIICFSSLSEIAQIKDMQALWAYEPKKNIGSCSSLNLEEILVALKNIKKLNLHGKLLYGGGVRTDNFLEIYYSLGDLVDGFLIGEKSLDSNFLKKFTKLISKVGKPD